MIFVDTGPLVARYLARDRYHDPVGAVWDRLSHGDAALYTSNFVLDELFTLLGRRAGYGFAAERARSIYASRRLQILRPDQDDEIRSIDFLEKYSDQKVSFTDCVSFALMKRHGIKRAFTLDRHFESAGFTRLDIPGV